MRVLITGSWLLHRKSVIANALSGISLIGIDPTHIVTGCWVGVDNLVSDFAKQNGISTNKIDLSKMNLPTDIDVVLIITLDGEVDATCTWIVEDANLLGIQVLTW